MTTAQQTKPKKQPAAVRPEYSDTCTCDEGRCTIDVRPNTGSHLATYTIEWTAPDEKLRDYSATALHRFADGAFERARRDAITHLEIVRRDRLTEYQLAAIDALLDELRKFTWESARPNLFGRGVERATAEQLPYNEHGVFEKPETLRITIPPALKATASVSVGVHAQRWYVARNYEFKTGDLGAGSGLPNIKHDHYPTRAFALRAGAEALLQIMLGMLKQARSGSIERRLQGVINAITAWRDKLPPNHPVSKISRLPQGNLTAALDHFGLTVHPLADRFPLITGDAWLDFVGSIKAGQLEPIKLLAREVIDGRNRLLACYVLGQQPRIEPFDEAADGSPTKYIMAKNLQRRDLSPDQRAVLALDSLPFLEEEGRQRKRAAGKATAAKKASRAKSGGEDTAPSNGQLVLIPTQAAREPTSRQQAAAIAGVSASKVQQAKAVAAAEPELIEEVRQGKTTLAKAQKQVAKRKPDPPAEPLTITVTLRKMPAEIANRMDDYADQRGLTLTEAWEIAARGILKCR